MFELINSRKFRNITSQVVTLLAVILFFAYITNNVFNNIEERGITTGFGFFNQSAGFGIAEAPIEYNDTTSTYFRAFLVGLLNTLFVSVAGIFFASIIGLIVGIARLSRNYLIAKLSYFYIEFFRNIPILLQILFWYNIVLASLPSPRQSFNIAGDIFLNNRGFYVPRPIFEDAFLFVLIALVLAIVIIYIINNRANKKFDKTGKETPVFLIGFAILIILPLLVYFIVGAPLSFEYPVLQGFNFQGGLNYSPEFLALTFALSIYTATYIAEAIRSGIQAVKKGQKEAAKSLGLSSYKALKIVILPQAVRIAIPPVINQYLNLTKNSSLATAIGYPELFTVFAGTSLTQTGQAIEIIFITMLVYLFISLSISLVLNIINKKLKIKGR
jgi:general L-amino acid transport system permease protein